MITNAYTHRLPTDGIPVKLKIVSALSEGAPVIAPDPEEQYDEPMSEVPEDIEDAALRYMDSEEAPSGVQRLEQVTEARFAEENGRVTITYNDSEMLEIPNTITQVTYSTEEPGIVAIVRSGGLNSMFVIEEGGRHTSKYSVGGYSLPLSFYGRRVRNDIKDGSGTLVLDYVVEMNGSVTQHTKMTLTLTK